MSFSHFQGIAYHIKDLAKQQGEKIHNLERYLLETAEGINMTSNVGLTTADGMQIVQEMIHYMLSHQVIYVPTPLATALMKTNIDMDIENIHIPFKLFELCFESDFKIYEDYIAPSCLVMTQPDQVLLSTLKSMFTKVNEFLRQRMNLYLKNKGEPEIPKTPINIDPKLPNMFSVRFKSPYDGSACHCALDIKQEAGRSVEDIINTINIGSTMLMPLNSVEKEIEKKILKIVLGVICYLNTSEPEVSKFKNRNRKSFGPIKPKEIILGEHFSNKEIGWHLRNAHWRFLKDEKFKRDEFGNIRCIWIRSAEVNKEERQAYPDRKIIVVSH